MTHKPIKLEGLSLSFPCKICFENFSYQIHYGSRIAIIGRNASGKSTLLKMITSMCGEDVLAGYVPQVILDNHDLSGGQRVNKALAEALSINPNILLLDEPTNHLDSRSRKHLMRRLQSYSGTLIIASHDNELLRYCTDILWHIDNGRVHIFSGNYDDYIKETMLKRASILSEQELLSRRKKDMHHKLMQEQQRAAKSKANGEKKVANRRWLKTTGDQKCAKAEKSHGKKLKDIDNIKSDLNIKLLDFYSPEIIIPKFLINSSKLRGVIINISCGAVGYSVDKALLSKIDLSLQSDEHIAIIGDNGSGKSTLIKAILGSEDIYKTGNWYVAKREDIGYLDQHYDTLDPCKTVFETIADLMLNVPHAVIRRYLNDFLFRKNEEVNALVSTLSGGEKARLSLAQIAAKTPKLLILDEITNNLDLETKEHVIQVLMDYPGAMIVISHDTDFLKMIGINRVVNISEFQAKI